MSELKKRIIVGLIGIPLGLLVIYIGGLVFNILILVVCLMALFEFYKIAEKKQYSPNWSLGVVLGCGTIIPYSIFIFHNEIPLIEDMLFGIQVAVGVGLAYLIVFLLTPVFLLFDKKENYLARIGVVFTGFFYITLPFFCLVLLRNLEHGFYYTILTFVSIWICDMAAYFVGSKFGKHRLAPNISPKKSVEGAIAGFITSATFFIITSNYLIEISLILSILLGVIIGILGQIGDLIESKLKRDAGVKDSSNLIPGHGGILDRFDSIIFVVPFVYIIIIFFTNL